MIHLNISIAIVLLTKLYTKKYNRILFKPFTCSPCMAFWIALIVGWLMGDLYYVLPTYLMAVYYDGTAL